MRKNPTAETRPQTIYDLMLAAELYRGRKGTGKGTVRKLKSLRKEITTRRKP